MPIDVLSLGHENIMSFREWFIKKHKAPDYEEARCVKYFNLLVNHLTMDGKHDKECMGRPSRCPICILEFELDEYYKYTKKWVEENK